MLLQAMIGLGIVSIGGIFAILLLTFSILSALLSDKKGRQRWIPVAIRTILLISIASLLTWLWISWSGDIPGAAN